MALPGSLKISYDDIRKEIGFANTGSFSLKTAESGSYTLLNRCSPALPVNANPVSLSEWYRYDHQIACIAYQFNAVQCTVSLDEACNASFNATQAAQGVDIVPMTVVGKDGDGLNEDWYVLNAEKFPNVDITVFKQVEGSLISSENVYHFTGPNFTYWNLVGNVGAYNGVQISTGLYYYTIYYNDGVRTSPLTGYIWIEYPKPGNSHESPFIYGATAEAACSGTTTALYRYTYGYLETTSQIFLAKSNVNDPLTIAPNGFYRRANLNRWYQLNNGIIVARGNC